MMIYFISHDKRHRFYTPGNDVMAISKGSLEGTHFSFGEALTTHGLSVVFPE